MDAAQLRAVAQRRPFAPFRLVMSDGRHYDVRHPEVILVGKTSSSIGVFDKYEEPKPDAIGPFPDLFVWVDNAHITTTIPLSVADQVGQSAT